MTRSPRRLAAATALALSGGSLLLAAPASAQDAGPTVRLLHGIPGTPVDVYVDGARALDDFQPSDVTDPLGLAPGTYSVAVVAADAADASSPVIGPVDLTVPDSGDVSVVAHLDAGGTPTVTPFVNDLSETPAGQGRLVVRHTAAAPEVDVLAGGSPVISGLANPREEALELPAGTVSAAVALAGTTDPVIGPADVPVTAGGVTVVYAIGSAEDSTLGVLTESLSAGSGAPGGVPAGTGGLVDEGVPTGAAAAGLAGLALLAAGGVALARSRA